MELIPVDSKHKETELFNQLENVTGIRKTRDKAVLPREKRSSPVTKNSLNF